MNVATRPVGAHAAGRCRLGFEPVPVGVQRPYRRPGGVGGSGSTGTGRCGVDGGLVLRWQMLVHRCSTRIYGPGQHTPPVRWIGDTRVGIGGVPTAANLPALPATGVTHVVNCRSPLQTWLSQDLAVERAMFGRDHVTCAPMWDTGRAQPPRRWAAAVLSTTRVLHDDPDARILIHCQHGRHRSVMIAYAVLRLRGYSPDNAMALLRQHHADPLTPYTASVECWLASTDPE
jgi:hypothetical protein